MPELARRQYDNRYAIRNYNYPPQGIVRELPRHSQQVADRPVYTKRTADKKKVERNYFIHRIISVAVVSLIGFSILPFGFNKVTKMMFNPTPYKEVKADYQQILFPTSNYISNHWIMGQRSLRGAEDLK